MILFPSIFFFSDTDTYFVFSTIGSPFCVASSTPSFYFSFSNFLTSLFFVLIFFSCRCILGTFSLLLNNMCHLSLLPLSVLPPLFFCTLPLSSLVKKVPLMAKRLEDSLYRNARSFKEYKDHTTLRHRLQQLAARLGTNTQQNRAKVGQPETERLNFGSKILSPHCPRIW